MENVRGPIGVVDTVREKAGLIARIMTEAELLKGSAPTEIETYEDSAKCWFAFARDPHSWSEIRVSLGDEASELDALRRLLAAFRVPLLAKGYLPPAEVRA